MTEGNDFKFLAALGAFIKFGPKRLPLLLQHLSSAEGVWRASAKQLQDCHIPEDVIGEFLIFKKDKNPEQILEELYKNDVRLISLDSPEYPPLLKEITNPPYILYIKGNLPPLGPALAVVGTRRVTSYGVRATQELISPLASQGIAIISGLAQGIDATAHRAALESKGYTLAVVAFGLQEKLIYPPAHRPLFQQIISSGGGILSEFPLDAHAMPQMFPQRNRLIAGLAKATLVIEAPAQSGALSTANFALEWNREVLAVPGPITHLNHAGTNKLIQKGAVLITCAEDICQALNWQKSGDTTIPKRQSGETQSLILNPTEQKIWQALSEVKHINELTKITNLGINDLSATLTILQMKGIVIALHGQHYERA